MKNGQAQLIRLLEGDAAAKWHLLFPLGAVKHRADFPRPIAFDEKTLRQMEANYAAEGKPERAINFFHRGPSDVGAPIDDKVAAGWLRDVVFDGSGSTPERDAGPGLYGLIGWTERARQYILKDELRYLSPEFVLESTSKDTGAKQGAKLLGAALLNDPFLTELPRVAASENQGAAMDRKLICAALGLAETATDEELNKAAQMKCEADKKMTEAKPEEEKAQAEVAAKMAEGEAAKLALSEAEKSVVSLSERVASLEKEKAELLSERTKGEVKAFFDGLIREGKCTPAIREGMEKLALANGLDSVRFLEKTPPIVAMGEVGLPGSTDEADAKKGALAKLEARVVALRESDKSLTYRDALSMAGREMPAEYDAAYGFASIKKGGK